MDQQTPFTDGQVKGNNLTLHLDAAGGLDFNLRLAAGRLQGTAVGKGTKAELDLQPAPGLLPHQELAEEITNADEQLFRAFDSCDVARYASLLSKELEFYQDRTGKTGYEENLKALRDRCAEGITLRRELDKNSLVECGARLRCNRGRHASVLFSPAERFGTARCHRAVHGDME